jgi:hypothetical protein
MPLHWREAAAGYSARRPSNFHLSRQMKVTKAKALNTSRLVTAAWLQDATCRLRTDPYHGTPVQRTPPLGSLRIAKMEAEAKRGVDRESLRSKRPYCSSGPVGGVEERRGLGPRAQHASSTDFARLFERSERSERSEFGARPQTPSTAEQSGPSRTATVGSPFFWFLFFGEAKKRDSAVGTTSRLSLTQ